MVHWLLLHWSASLLTNERKHVIHLKSKPITVLSRVFRACITRVMGLDFTIISAATCHILQSLAATTYRFRTDSRNLEPSTIHTQFRTDELNAECEWRRNFKRFMSVFTVRGRFSCAFLHLNSTKFMIHWPPSSYNNSNLNTQFHEFQTLSTSVEFLHKQRKIKSIPTSGTHRNFNDTLCTLHVLLFFSLSLLFYVIIIIQLPVWISQLFILNTFAGISFSFLD